MALRSRLSSRISSAIVGAAAIMAVNYILAAHPYHNGNRHMQVALISTYELGRQPFGIASPAAWLERAGHEVLCIDPSRQRLPLEAIAEVGLVAFYLPMHTATRLALPLIEKMRNLRPKIAHLFNERQGPTGGRGHRQLEGETTEDDTSEIQSHLHVVCRAP